jgi:hypothetical protein
VHDRGGRAPQAIQRVAQRRAGGLIDGWVNDPTIRRHFLIALDTIGPPPTTGNQRAFGQLR